MLTGLFKDVRFGPFSTYTRVFHLWYSVALNNVGDSRPFFFSLVCFPEFRIAPHPRFRCRHLKLCLVEFLKMLDLALS